MKEQVNIKLISLTLCLVLLMILISDGIPNEFIVGNADSQITVTFSAGTNLFFNGVPFICESEDGMKVLPIIYEGTTYIPLATLSKLVGIKFVYDKVDKCIIQTNEEVVKYPTKLVIKQPGVPKRDTGTPELTKNYIGTVLKKYDISISTDEDSIYLVDDKGKEYNVFLTDMDCYIPLRVIAPHYGLVVEWNKLQNGVDIFTESFANLRNMVVSGKLGMTEVVKSDITDLRYWLAFNLVFDIGIITDPIPYYKKEDGSYYVNNIASIVLPYVNNNRVCINSFVKIAEGLNIKDKSDKEKVLAITKYICAKYIYNDEGAKSGKYARTLSEILSTNLQVCEGYARTFQMLCRALGVQCDYIVGYVENTKGEIICHAWNRVFIDGEWLYCDTTIADTNNDINKWILRTDTDFKSIRNQYWSGVHF